MRIFVPFLKLSHRIYAPFAAAALRPLGHDAALPDAHRSQLESVGSSGPSLHKTADC